MLLKRFGSTQERLDYIQQDIQEYAKNCFDTIVKAKQISRASDKDMWVFTHDEENQDTEINISTHAEGQLFSKLEIPTKYIRRCPFDLQAVNINHWLQDDPERQFLFRNRFQEESCARVRAIFSTRYSNELDDHKVFPVVFEALRASCENSDLEDLHLRDYTKDEAITELRVLYKSMKVSYGNEMYWAGLHIINSEVGISAFRIQPLIRGGTPAAAFDFLDKTREGVFSIRHIGDLSTDAIRLAIAKAAKVSQVGIHQLLKAGEQIVASPGQTAKTFIENCDFIPNGIGLILQDEWKEIQEASKLAVAKSMLTAIKDLPVYSKYLAEREIGRYLHLFQDTENRLAMLADDII